MTPNGKIAAVLAVTILAISGTVIAFAVTDPDRDVTIPFINDGNTTKYSITYVLDGGTNPDDAPDSYTSKKIPELPTPSKDGYVFTGWLLSEDAEEAITEIPKDSKADITLYATWEESMVGTRVVFEHYLDFSSAGYAQTPVIVTFDYVSYVWTKGYLMCMTSDGERISSYWTSDNEDTVWTKAETTEDVDTLYFDTKVCEKWSSRTQSGYEIQYIGADDGEVYRIDLIGIFNSFFSSSQVITDRFELKEITDFDPTGYFTMEVYPDKGITVTQTGGEYPGAQVTLTAEASGVGFKGWYDADMRLLSTERTYGTTLSDDVVIFALNDDDHDYTDSITSVSNSIPLHTSVPLTDISWQTYSNLEADNGSGTGSTITVNRVGTYDVDYSGKDSQGRTVYGTYTVLVDGYYSFSWTYKGTPYTVSTDISASDYLSYSENSIARYDKKNGHILNFVTYQDPTIKSLADNLSALCAGKSQKDTANIVLAYVQSIPYQYDSDFNGQDEYWKYALETVFDGAGDCEDTSILYSALMKAMGYDTAIATLYVSDSSMYIRSSFLNSANHCMSLVYVLGVTPEADAIVSINSDTYYLCETTATGYDVGQNPWTTSSVKTKYVVG